jgi:hypothetical protein
MPGEYAVLELANQQDIPYGKCWELVRLLASIAVVLLQHCAWPSLQHTQKSYQIRFLGGRQLKFQY